MSQKFEKKTDEKQLSLPFLFKLNNKILRCWDQLAKFQHNGNIFEAYCKEFKWQEQKMDYMNNQGGGTFFNVKSL